MMLQERVAQLCDAVPGMTKASAVMFISLWDARGRTLTYGRLAEDASANSPDSTTEDAMRSTIQRLRRIIADAALPVTILTRYDIGYRMVRLDPAWTWE
jgi:DNA-binding response OmpR family regulator